MLPPFKLEPSSPACLQLVVVGATNRVNSIDEALRRPGRFEREIAVDPPDGAPRFKLRAFWNFSNLLIFSPLPSRAEQARRAILEVHTKHMRLATDVDLSLLAKDCLRCASRDGSCFTGLHPPPTFVYFRFYSYVGADLAALCREAGIVALRAGARTISQQHFATAQKYIVPSGRRDVEVSDFSVLSER